MKPPSTSTLVPMSDHQPVSACCSLDETDFAERRQRWRRLAARALIGAERGEGGARQRLHAADGVEAECCPSLSFELSVGEELVLDVRGPAESAGVLDLFASPLEFAAQGRKAR